MLDKRWVRSLSLRMTRQLLDGLCEYDRPSGVYLIDAPQGHLERGVRAIIERAVRDAARFKPKRRKRVGN